MKYTIAIQNWVFIVNRLSCVSCMIVYGAISVTYTVNQTENHSNILFAYKCCTNTKDSICIMGLRGTAYMVLLLTANRSPMCKLQRLQKMYQCTICNMWMYFVRMHGAYLNCRRHQNQQFSSRYKTIKLTVKWCQFFDSNRIDRIWRQTHCVFVVSCDEWNNIKVLTIRCHKM